MFEDFQLPDGTMAESVEDVERYLKDKVSADVEVVQAF